MQTLLLAALLQTPAAATWSPPEQAPEFGAVRWERDFDAASARARESGLPLLVLFQEVPG